MPEEADSKPKSKHRKSTCSGCRRRKSKCDGKVPACSTCIAYKDECHYDKPPSLAYVRALEDELAELKNQVGQIKTQAWLTKTASSDTERKISPASPASQSSNSQAQKSPYESTTLPHRNLREIKFETDISVDDDGSVHFHNSTSAVHQPPSEVHGVTNQMPLAHAIALAKGPSEENSREALVTNANRQKQWEQYAIANTAVNVNVPADVSNELLKYHWSWVHPLFLMVYRPAFIRSMALTNAAESQRPPYFSETLLRVIHGHCARFLNHSVRQLQYQTLSSSSTPIQITLSAAEFMERMTQEARTSLGMETLKESSIPTIQALLQQSTREIVFGESSQAWLYSGMAFRMAFDMGIHLPSDKLQMFVKSLSPEDIEIRKRLFWSCYTWDKIISLYLGRMPAFTPSTDNVPVTFMDDYSDTDCWTPYYGETPAPELNAANYAPRPGYVVSCFKHLCKLCVILNDLLQGIYSPTSPNTDSQTTDTHTRGEDARSSESSFIRVSRSLHTFWSNLPQHLLISPSRMPTIAPPIHIVSLNLTYHTTLILLHRPLVLSSTNFQTQTAQRSYATCIAATAAIHDLLVLQATTFSLTHLSYLNAYAAYIAATIAVLRFEREHKSISTANMSDEPQQARSTANSLELNFLVEVLQRTATAMPALERSVAIIKKRMKAVLDRQAQSHLNSLFSPSTISGAAAPPLFNTVPSHHNLNHTSGANASVIPPQQPFATGAATYDPSHVAFTANHHQPGIPMQWQSSVRGSLYAEPAPPSFKTEAEEEHDFLPPFPGQQLFTIGGVGGGSGDGRVSTGHGGDERGSAIGNLFEHADHSVDPAARAALMGYSHLDPHPRFDAADLDLDLHLTWSGGAAGTGAGVGDAFMGGEGRA